MKKTTNARLTTAFTLTLTLALCGSAFADIGWTGSAGNDLLDDPANWAGAIEAANTLRIGRAPITAFAVSSPEASLFGGCTLRYSAGTNAGHPTLFMTNAFGAGNILTDVGLSGQSALHVEKGASLTQLSGIVQAYKGTVFSGSYVSDDSALTLTGPDTEFRQLAGSLCLRTSSVGSRVARPELLVTDGAKLLIPNGQLEVGGGHGNCGAVATLSGEGTTASMFQLRVGSVKMKDDYPNEPTLYVTNGAALTVTGNGIVGSDGSNARMIVAGAGSRTDFAELHIGHNDTPSNCLVRIESGGSFTTTGSVYIASWGDDSHGADNRLEVVGEDATCIVGELLNIRHSGLLRVGAGGRADLNRFTINEGGRAEVASGGTLKVTTGFWIDGPLVVNGGTFVNGVTTGTSQIDLTGTLAATNSTVTLEKQTFDVSGKAIFKGGTLDYNQIRMKTDGSELVLEDTVANGTRIEMNRASTIRLQNAKLTLPSGIFMMGNGSGPDNLERHVYVGGSNAWLKTMQSNGFYVRGKQTTIHVAVPKEGFATDHAVFDVKGLSYDAAGHATMVITAEEEHCLAGGGTYPLINNVNLTDNHLTFEYDPKMIRLETKNGVVYVKVKSHKGLAVIVR